MTNHTRKLILALIIIMGAGVPKTQGQEFVTDDQIPGLNPNYRPSLQPHYPTWAKMLYNEPINFYVVDSIYRSWKLSYPDSHSPIERYYKIWRREVQPFIALDGSISTEGLEQYRSNLIGHQLSAPDRADPSVGGSWEFVGPKETFWLNESGSPETPAACPWQVNVYNFDVAKTDYRTIYAGTETGFVNKTVDNGETWTMLGRGYNFGGAVTAVSIDPSNKDIVYAAAGEQIHKTVDGGQTWTPLLMPGEQFRADRIMIDDLNADHLVAAGSNGVFQSYDAGTSWSQESGFSCLRRAHAAR